MNPKSAFAVFALTLMLAGCGNKGPLVLAKPPAPVESPVTAPGAVPVEVVPDPVVSDPAPVVPVVPVPPVEPDPLLDPPEPPEPPTDTDD